uniref:G-protein coupled receptors family 2 profile 2 domain-containing protein n=1 Tax=Biomphalaria glabrata TaxID=6526 RepID=A0A2C9L794_BIOGL
MVFQPLSSQQVRTFRAHIGLTSHMRRHETPAQGPHSPSMTKVVIIEPRWTNYSQHVQNGSRLDVPDGIRCDLDMTVPRIPDLVKQKHNFRIQVSSVNISPHEEVKFTTEPFTEFDKLNSADESSVTEFDGLNTLDTSQQVKNSYTEIEHESTLGQNVKTFDWLESAAVYTASVDLTESLPTSAVSYDRNDSSVNESSTPSRGIADFSSRIKPVSGTDSNMDRTSINLPRTEISKIIIGTNVIKSCRLRPQLNASETQLCEASNVINAETLTVLLDKETNLTYQNIFCAKCNNVTAKLTPAKLKVKCRSAMFIYKATHLDSLLKMALESGSNCIVTQTWSEENVTLCMPTKYCCPFRCNKGQMSKSAGYVGGEDSLSHYCRYCKCEKLKCEAYDMCCPDFSEPYLNQSKNLLNLNESVSNFTSGKESFRIDCKPDQPMMIRSCQPRIESNMTVVELCESGRLINVETVTAVFDNVTKVAYQNRFCAQCNNATQPVQANLDITCSTRMFIYMATTLDQLLQLAWSRNSTCTVNQVWDSNFVAFNCTSNGKSFVKIDSAVDILQPPGGILPEQRESLTTFLLNFDADSYMAPEEPGSPLVFYRAYCSAGEWSSPDFQQWLSKLNVEYNITADVFNLTSPCQDVSLYFTASPCKMKLNARLLGPDNVSRDEFESLVLEYFVNGSITLEEELGAYFTLETLYTTSWKSALVDFITMNESVLDVSRDSTYIKSAKYGSKIAEELLIEMTNLLRCGHVTFNKSEYLLNMLGSGLLSEFTLTINLNVTKVTLSEAKDLNYILLEESGELKVCLDILENKLKEIQEANKFWRRNSNAALYVVSLTCSVVSLVCLVLTILTYLIHPVLRTFAGKNNMMLSLSLLLAQTSLLAAAHMEYTGNVCTFLGISTHFLWLWMFSWTFICSLDMFLVFTAKTRRSCCENEFKSFIKRCLFSVVLPMMVVSVVVMVTYIQTSGQDIGYGSMRCYLDSIVSTGVALAGPLFTIVFCNTIFFVTTVVKIHKVRQLKTSDLKKEEQSDLIVYVKLSAMTGVFWLLATIAQVSQNKYFQFIVEPINGLQGVYIFMSYVCNRRVLRLYLQIPTLDSKPDIHKVGYKSEIPTLDCKPDIHKVGYKSEIPTLDCKPDIHKVGYKSEIPTLDCKPDIHKVGYKSEIPKLDCKPDIPILNSKLGIPVLDCTPEMNSIWEQSRKV